jgi:hypothetical protein
MGGHSFLWAFSVEKIGFEKDPIASPDEALNPPDEVNGLPKTFKDFPFIITFALNN